MLNAVLVDDDSLFLKITRLGLKRHNIACRALSSFGEAFEYISQELPDRTIEPKQPATADTRDKFKADVIILDYYLDDGKTGLSLCKKIRKKSNIPIVMISSENSLKNTILCLEEGADQYVYKSANFYEFIARIKSSMRARNSLATDLAPLKLDSKLRKLSCGTQSIKLTEKECSLTKILIATPNSPVSKEDIFTYIYGNSDLLYTRRLDVLAGRLRKKLLQLTEQYKIMAIRNSGYMLAGYKNDYITY